MELNQRKIIYKELKEVNGIETAAARLECTVEHFRNVMTRLELHKNAELFAEIAIEVIKGKRDAQKLRLQNLVVSL